MQSPGGKDIVSIKRKAEDIKETFKPLKLLFITEHGESK